MKKKDWIIIVELSLVLCLVIGLYFKNTNKEVKETTTDTYDISTMKQVGVSDILKMFNDKGTYVLYIGRSTCSVCLKLLPTLKQAQIDNNYITQYLDITATDRTSSDWTTLVNKLDIKTTASISETDNDEAEKVTNTYGYFLNKYGFTPTVIIIKNGKQVAGFIGNKTLPDFNSWYTENTK